MDTKADVIRSEKPPDGPDHWTALCIFLGNLGGYGIFFSELRSENKVEEAPKGHVQERTVQGVLLVFFSFVCKS